MIGRLVGDNQRYRLDKGLGGGSMGEVFLATDTRIGKEVALKLLKDKWLASGEMRKRFEREIAICAALQSEHIIEISDCGVTDEGFPFYVMEYLRGQTLRYLMLREKQLPPERTVKIMIQVCKGLQLAHQGVIMQRDASKTSSDRIKVIHRDLKPENIFLSSREFEDRVKILDFGIAKIHHDSSEQTNLTKTFIGTFRYASLEQIRNDKNIDARADIYSLGIILYEMLSAADPFGLSVDGSRVTEDLWLHAHGYKQPIPLKQQPGCEHLSSQLEAVVLKCLQKKPSNRFASVEELRQALQAAIQPVTGSTYVQQQVIVRSKLQQPQLGSNDETVFKPQQPFEQNKPQKGSNDETVFKPQQPGLEIQSEIANSQPQPLLNQNLNQLNQDQPNTLETELFQQPPASNQPQEQILEGTIVQHPASNSQQQTPDNTIFQIRTPTGAEPSIPDNTIYQPRAGSNPDQQQQGNSPMVRSQQDTSSGETPEKTIYQPRPDSLPSGQHKPENTTYQRGENNVEPQNNFNVLRILGITLAVGLLLSLIYYFAFGQHRANDRIPQKENLQSYL